MMTRNPAASVRARLLNKARADGVDFQLLLTRYGLERLLYRLRIPRVTGQRFHEDLDSDSTRIWTVIP